MQRYIRIILFFIVFIVIIVGCSFLVFYQKKEIRYLDTIDATTVVDDVIYAVGRNNDNDKELTKAKFSIYNSKQEKIYEKLYNTGYTSRFYDLLVDDEDVVIVGEYEKTKKDYKNNNSIAVILKYDEEGQLLFEKEVSDTNFYDVLAYDDGYLAIGTSHDKNKTKGVLVKFHTDGTLDWKKEYGTENTEFTAGVFYHNKIYVTGIENQSGVLVSFSRDGKLIDSIHEETDSLGFSSITVVADSLVLSGGKKVTEDFSQPLLVKYDLDLSYIDSAIYDSKYSGRFLKVITDNNDDLVVLASTVEGKKDKDVHHAYIGKYREDLTEASVVPYYNEEDDYFTDVSLMHDTYLVSGYSFYSEQGYLSKFLSYSEALKVLEVK